MFSYPLDILISNFLKKSLKSPFEKQVWNYIYDNKEIPEIAIYGSSKAWVQISPTILKDTLQKKVYNYGFDGQNFELEYLRHLEIKKNKKLSKNIILILDIGSFQVKKQLYNHKDFLPFLLFNENMKKFLEPYNYFDSYDYEIPLKRYTSQGMEFVYLFEKDNNPRKNGYASRNETWNNDFIIAKKTNKNLFININKKQFSLFEKFIIETKKNNLNLILITTPNYIEGQKFMINSANIILEYSKTANKYKIPYLNYYNDSIIYKRNLFYNATHLNKNGAEILSKKIAHDLKKLIK